MVKAKAKPRPKLEGRFLRGVQDQVERNRHRELVFYVSRGVGGKRYRIRANASDTIDMLEQSLFPYRPPGMVDMTLVFGNRRLENRRQTIAQARIPDGAELTMVHAQLPKMSEDFWRDTAT